MIVINAYAPHLNIERNVNLFPDEDCSIRAVFHEILGKEANPSDFFVMVGLYNTEPVQKYTNYTFRHGDVLNLIPINNLKELYASGKIPPLLADALSSHLL